MSLQIRWTMTDPHTGLMDGRPLEKNPEDVSHILQTDPASEDESENSTENQGQDRDDNNVNGQIPGGGAGSIRYTSAPLYRKKQKYRAAASTEQLRHQYSSEQQYEHQQQYTQQQHYTQQIQQEYHHQYHGEPQDGMYSSGSHPSIAPWGPAAPAPRMSCILAATTTPTSPAVPSITAKVTVPIA